MRPGSLLTSTATVLLALVLIRGSHSQGFGDRVVEHVNSALRGLSHFYSKYDWFFSTRPDETFFNHPQYPTPNCTLQGWSGYDCTFSIPNSISLLSKQSLPYCSDINKGLGGQTDTRCDFTGVNETVYLDTRRSEDPKGHKLHVKGAKVLSYFATCGFTLTLNGVKQLNVTSAARESRAPMCYNDNELFAHFIKTDYLQYNFRKLDLVDSSVGTVWSSVEVETMSLLRSNVGWLHFKGRAEGDENTNRYTNGIEIIHVQLYIEDCFLDNIERVEFRSSTWSMLMQNSSVGTIKKSGIVINNELAILNSSIKKFNSNGVIGSSRSLMVLNDSLIEHMASHAIIMQGSSNLYINNVIIKQCRVPCIVVNDKSNLLLRNVTINGEVVHKVSSAFLFHDNNILSTGDRQIFWSSHKGCHKDNNVLTCNLDYLHEPIIMTPGYHWTYSQVNLNNVDDVALYYECGEPSFRLVNVTGMVYPQGDGDLTCSDFLNFTISKSLLHHLHPSSPARVVAKYTSIKLLSGSSSLNLQLNSTIIETLRNVTLRGNSQVWFNTTIGELQDVVIDSNLTMKKTVITYLKDVLVNKSLTLSEVALTGDLTVTNFGHLIWKNFVFTSSIDFLITLEPEATISIRNIEIPPLWLAHKVLVANYYNQVVKFPSYENSSVWLADLVILRPPQEYLLDYPHESFLKVALKDDRFCHGKDSNNDNIICDYSSASSANIEHDMSHFKFTYISEQTLYKHFRDTGAPTLRSDYPYHTNSSKKIRFVNADILQLDENFPYLFNVTIENVKRVSPIRFVFSSPLTLINSQAMFMDMLDSATLTVRHSSVNYLALDHKKNIYVTKSASHGLRLQNATVRNLHITVNGLRVDGSNLEKIIKCKILGEAVVSSTQISSIRPHAMFVDHEACLQLSDVTIDEIKEEGLIVEGILRMRNVLIRRLQSHGIILGRRAKSVTFENVVIENGSQDSIVDLNKKVITKSNMTLNGNSYLALKKGVEVMPEHAQLNTDNLFNNGTHRMLRYLVADDGRILKEMINATGTVVERKYVAMEEWLKAKKLQPRNSAGNIHETESAMEVKCLEIMDKTSLSSPTSYVVSSGHVSTTTKEMFSVFKGSTTPEQTEKFNYQIHSPPVTSETTLAVVEKTRVINNPSSLDFVSQPCTNSVSSPSNLPVHSLKSSETIVQQHAKKMLHINGTTEQHSNSSTPSTAVGREIVALAVVLSMIGAYIAYFKVLKGFRKRIRFSIPVTQPQEAQFESAIVPSPRTAPGLVVNVSAGTNGHAVVKDTTAREDPLDGETAVNNQGLNAFSRAGLIRNIGYSAMDNDEQELAERHNDDMSSVSVVNYSGEVSYKNFK